MNYNYNYSRKPKKRDNLEEKEQMKIVEALSLIYPNLRVYGSLNGIKLQPYQVTIAKKMGLKRSYPDLHILDANKDYTSLYIEYKSSKAEMYKMCGTLRKNNHIWEQMEALQFLQKQGNAATFALGFENAMRCVSDYVNNNFTNVRQDLIHKYTKI